MPHIVVGTAGHIDHGKSTLVKALTGIDPDRLKEEQARGITIELGFAHTTIDDVTVAFVDVPGHERFVRTMLAGAGGIDCVLLIVAADESVMPQTREHFDICRLLGVEHGLVVLTKIDATDPDTVAVARLEVEDLVAGSFLDGAPVVAVSAKTGQGLAELRRTIVAVCAGVRRRRADGEARLPIDRVFSMAGFGTVVTGTLVSGRIGVDDELQLVPGDRLVRVRGVQVHGQRRAEAVAGERTALNLGGIEVAEIARGQAVAAPGALSVTRRADVMLELLPSARALRHGSRVRIHQGTDDVLGRVSIVGPVGTVIDPGARAPVRLRFERPVALTRGDRLIVRAYSPATTIGGGVVLDPEPPRAGVRTPALASRFVVLATADEEAVLAQMVADAGRDGLTLEQVVARGGANRPAGEARLATLRAAGRVIQSHGRVFDARLVSALETDLVAMVADHHRAEPLAEGLPREEARERLCGRAPAELFDAVLERLCVAGQVIARDRLAVRGHQLALTDEEEAAKAAIERLYRDAGLKPPDKPTLVAELRWDQTLVERMSVLLVRQKRLVRVDTLTFHADALAELKAALAALKGSEATRVTVDVQAFKERYGVSRKFAIPLLEWLDRERVTRRMGDVRVVL